MKLRPITWLGTISALRRSLPRPERAGDDGASARRAPAESLAAIGAGVLLGIGVRLIVTADLGVAPLDIAMVAISDRSGIGLGFVALVVQAVLLTIAWRLGRPPVRATWLFVAAAGLTLQANESIIGEVESIPFRIMMWAAGFVVIVIGLGLVVAGTHAGGSFELLSRAGADRGLSPVWVRTALEVGVVIAGLALGGPIGIGSVVFAVAVGPSASFAARRWAAKLGAGAHTSSANL